MWKTIFGIFAALVAVALIRVVTLSGGGQDDQTAIRKVLEDSIKASREGRAGSVLDKLSDQLVVNDRDSNVSTRQIAQFIKQQKPDLTVGNYRAVVNGDEAILTTPVDLNLSFLGQSRSLHMKDVVLVFHREDGREWLVIPTKKWRLAEVRAPNVDPSALME